MCTLFSGLSILFPHSHGPLCLSWLAKPPKEPKPTPRKLCAKCATQMPLEYTEPLCQVCIDRLVKKQSDAIYTKIFGSVREDMAITFKDLKKFIADVKPPTAPSGSSSPIAAPRSVVAGDGEGTSG